MDESTNNQEEKYLTITANVLGYLGSLPFIALAVTISVANTDAVVIAKSALYLLFDIIPPTLAAQINIKSGLFFLR